MMHTRRFIQCDVFTHTPTRGNALAVVMDGEGLTDDAMATFAAWTNVAETAFMLPPTHTAADYQLRIFTPAQELPFAGHPTLGTCAAWLHLGGKPKEAGIVRQECGVGIVDIPINGEVPAFVAPPTTIAEMSATDQERIAKKLALGTETVLATAVLNNGPQWQVIELASASDVLKVDSSRVRWPEEQYIGLIGAYPTGSAYDYEVRMLAPSSGMSEDPITGSLNAALAHWLNSRNKLPDAMVVSQGTNIGRFGRVYISKDAQQPERILIGGHTHVLVEGTVKL